MPKTTSYITPAQQEPAKMIRIKAKDDFYVLRRKKGLPRDEVNGRVGVSNNWVETS